MSHTIKNAAGAQVGVQTFHESGVAEARITLLVGKKRVDFHIFELSDAGLQNITLLDLLDVAEDAKVKDASKFEIGKGNVGDYDFTTVKDLQKKLAAAEKAK